MSSRSQFQEDLGSLRHGVDWLGALAEDAVRAATVALLEGDRTKAEVVENGDDELDALFLQLEESAYSLIARQAPVAVDLRFLVSALRVTADFERMGDLAVSIAKLALAAWRPEPISASLLSKMAESALDLISAARLAWRNQDLALAAKLEGRDDELDSCYRRLAAHLVVQHGPDAGGLVFHALLAGRHLERIADHAVAVGDRVAYMVTGDPKSLAAEIR
ncbi:MAG: phosphate signaling complex protein PhoU [Acidimicrobiales bacterium]